MEKIVKYLFLLIFLIFPLGQLISFYPDIPCIPGWVRIHPLDWLVGGLIITWVVWQLVARKKIKALPGAKLILAFIAIALLSWVINLKNYTQLEILVAFLYLLRWTVYAGMYFLIFNFSFKPAMLLLISGLISAVFGLLQYIFFPDVRALTALGWDPHYYRVVGTFLDPGFSGMIYVLSLIFLVSQAANSSTSEECFAHHPRCFLSGSFIILYAALALTYSRASYLAFLIGMGMIAYFKKSWRFFAFITLLLAMTILILPQPGGEGVKLERTSTIRARIEDWQHAIQIIKDHPLIGVGFNFYRFSQRDYGFLEEDWQESHAGAGSSSSFLFVFATTGVFGFLAYLLTWVSLISCLKQKWLASPVAIREVALSSSIALLVHSFFNHSLFYPWIMLWMWIILGTALKDKEII